MLPDCCAHLQNCCFPPSDCCGALAPHTGTIFLIVFGLFSFWMWLRAAGKVAVANQRVDDLQTCLYLTDQHKDAVTHLAHAAMDKLVATQEAALDSIVDVVETIMQETIPVAEIVDDEDLEDD